MLLLAPRINHRLDIHCGIRTVNLASKLGSFQINLICNLNFQIAIYDKRERNMNIESWSLWQLLNIIKSIFKWWRQLISSWWNSKQTSHFESNRIQTRVNLILKNMRNNSPPDPESKDVLLHVCEEQSELPKLGSVSRIRPWPRVSRAHTTK